MSTMTRTGSLRESGGVLVEETTTTRTYYVQEGQVPPTAQRASGLFRARSQGNLNAGGGYPPGASFSRAPADPRFPGAFYGQQPWTGGYQQPQPQYPSYGGYGGYGGYAQPPQINYGYQPQQQQYGYGHQPQQYNYGYPQQYPGYGQSYGTQPQKTQAHSSASVSFEVKGTKKEDFIPTELPRFAKTFSSITSIGITYRANPHAKLQNTVNDSMAICNHAWENWGVCAGNAFLLNDVMSKKDSAFEPNKAAMLKAMDDFVTRVNGDENNELHIFHFSGHGTQVEEKGPVKKEKDGKNEVILASDMELISDDEIADHLFEPIVQGKTVVMLADNCHAGWDLKYKVQMGRKGKLDTTVQEFDEQNADIILIGTSDDSETSADGIKMGAGTRAFLETLKNKSLDKVTPRELVQQGQAFLDSKGYRQTFTLLMSKNKNLDEPLLPTHLAEGLHKASYVEATAAA